MKVTQIGGHKKPVSKIAAYCRVSTDKTEQAESFETQRRYYSKLIEEHENWEPAGIYADEGRSGTSVKHRPQFMQMLEDAKEKKFDIILVKSISRFARNAADAQNYAAQLRAYGVEVRFEREGIKNTDPSANFIFSVLALVAQEESRSISENTRWRYQKNFENGVYRMGNNRLLGFDMNSDGKLAPNGDAWIVRRVFDDYIGGMNLCQIAADLDGAGAKRMRSNNPFTAVTIRRMLQNVAYVGDLHLQKNAPLNYLTKKPMTNVEYRTYYVKNDHVGIVSRESWDEVQARIKKIEAERSVGIVRNTTKTHYLYGIVFCGECKKPMLRRTCTASDKTKYKAWNCRGRQKEKNGCKNPYIRETVLLDKIKDALKTRGIDFENDFEATVRTYITRIEVKDCGVLISFRDDFKKA